MTLTVWNEHLENNFSIGQTQKTGRVRISSNYESQLALSKSVKICQPPIEIYQDQPANVLTHLHPFLQLKLKKKKKKKLKCLV